MRTNYLTVSIFWLVQASALLVVAVPFSWPLVALWAASHFLRAIGLTLAFHRYFAHRAFQMHRLVRFAWAGIGTAAMQKGPLWWAGHHVNHHRFADRERDGLERVEVREQAVDLEGADKAALDAEFRVEVGDRFVAEPDFAAVGLQHAGDQVDQRGLARAVWSDQCVAHALRQLERDVARHDQRAEALVEAARGEGGDAHDALRQNISGAVIRFQRSEAMSCASPPRMPFGRNSTTAISRMPIGKYQYCGLMPEN